MRKCYVSFSANIYSNSTIKVMETKTLSIQNTDLNLKLLSSSRLLICVVHNSIKQVFFETEIVIIILMRQTKFKRNWMLQIQ